MTSIGQSGPSIQVTWSVLTNQGPVLPVLIYHQPRVSPAHNEERIEGDAEVLVVYLRDILEENDIMHQRLRIEILYLDVNSHTDGGLSLVGKIKFWIVIRNADGVPLGADAGQ